MPVYDSFISSYRVPKATGKSGSISCCKHTAAIRTGAPQDGIRGGRTGRTSVEIPIDGARHSRPTERRPDKNNDGRGASGATASKSGNRRYFP